MRKLWKAMKITAKAVMEQLNQIEEMMRNEAEEERPDRLLCESEIRWQMPVEHARWLLDFGVDMEKIGKVTDLRTEFIENFCERMIQ